MKRTLWTATAMLLVLTCVLTALTLYTASAVLEALAITAGTFFFHLIMRLIVGTLIGAALKGRIDLEKEHWKEKPFEKKLYKALKVKKWKNSMPAYDPLQFDPAKKSWKEIAEASCISEAVHTTNAVLSCIPLLFSIPFGSFTVFLITSIIASMIDLSFVVMQRYNRERILPILKRKI